MIKKLPTTLFLAFVLFSVCSNAQNNFDVVSVDPTSQDTLIIEMFDLHKISGVSSEEISAAEVSSIEESHNHSEQGDCDHSHTHHISLMDIITSDEGADFNCSGGFCMDRSHFHKKGLTLKRQLFDYFITVSYTHLTLPTIYSV